MTKEQFVIKWQEVFQPNFNFAIDEEDFQELVSDIAETFLGADEAPGGDSHNQNTDTKLAEGTQYEVTAAQLKKVVTNFNKVVATYDPAEVVQLGWVRAFADKFWEYINDTPGAEHEPAENQYWKEISEAEATAERVNQAESEAAAGATQVSNVSDAKILGLKGLWWFWNKVMGLLFGFAPLTFGATVVLNLNGKKKVNRTLTVTSTSFILDVQGVGAATDGCEIDIKCKFSGVTNTLVNLNGNFHTDSGISISALYYSDIDGGEFRLIGKVEGGKIDWVTRDGVIVQELTASTSDIPSVGLVKKELEERFKRGGNAFGAGVSIGLTDNFTLTILQNNLEAISFTSTNSRIRGFVLLGSNSGTAHSHQQSAGSVAKFIRTITAARTLDNSDNHILANGTFNVTLPTAVGVLGRVYHIKNTGSGIITIGTTSNQTIDGATSKSLNAQYNWIEVISDNSNWQIIGQWI